MNFKRFGLSRRVSFNTFVYLNLPFFDHQTKVQLISEAIFLLSYKSTNFLATDFYEQNKQ